MRGEHITVGDRAISTQDKGILLSIIELGGYPDFSPLYRRCGFQAEGVTSVRNAVRYLKKVTPRIVVAEFNYQSDFRDRTSNLETLMAVMQRLPETQVIVFYEKEFAHQFNKLRDRFPLYQTFMFPVDETALQDCLQQI